MRPIITELDNSKRGSIRTDVADLVMVKYVLQMIIIITMNSVLGSFKLAN